jgi:protein-S-isoprenylcysteine O-methyltransferase Ste14
MFGSMALVEAFQFRPCAPSVTWQPLKSTAANFATRLAGILAVVASLGSLYWVFPEYSGEFYRPFFRTLAEYWWFLFALGLPILWFECSTDPHPSSSLEYKAGLSVIELAPSRLTRSEWMEFILTWLLRIFFIPVVFAYFCAGVESFWKALSQGGLAGNFEGIYGLLLMTESAFACVGYLFCTRLLGTQIRSVDKTAAGWVSALACYPPFWSTLTVLYLGKSGSSWVKLVEGNEVLQVAYASFILVFMTFFTWANISFGTRFTNLTHRGIIFAGPYRFLRHPAYVSQMIALFAITTPFWRDNLFLSLQALVMYAAMCAIYYVRAKTEERNLLSQGLEYALYKRLVRRNQHRIKSRLNVFLKRLALPGLAP